MACCKLSQCVVSCVTSGFGVFCVERDCVGFGGFLTVSDLARCV